MGRKKQSNDTRKAKMDLRKQLNGVTKDLNMYLPHIGQLIRIGQVLSLNINRWMYDGTDLPENSNILTMVEAMDADKQQEFYKKFLLTVLNLREYQERVSVQYSTFTDILDKINEYSKELKTSTDPITLSLEFTSTVTDTIGDNVDKLEIAISYLKVVYDQHGERIGAVLGSALSEDIEELISSMSSSVDEIRNLEKESIEEILDNSSKITVDGEELPVMEDTPIPQEVIDIVAEEVSKSE